MTPFEQFAQDYTDKKVLIFGLGIQGRGVGDAQIFAQIGSRVTITDTKSFADLKPSLEQLQKYKIDYSLGDHKEADITNADVIIRNASVPWNHPLLNLARQKNIPIKTDESLFFEYARPTKTIGVTGTRGKTTTTTLIYTILSAGGVPAILAGNITETASLHLLATFNPQYWYVFELSSWQLQPLHDLHYSPQLAVVTNIYPDHLLDRSFNQYIADKTAIFLYQKPDDTVFLNHKNPHTRDMAQQARGKVTWFSQIKLPDTWQIKLKGDHNRENIKAAVAVAEALQIPEHIVRRAIEGFTSVPFRLEVIGRTREGIVVINDTTSTTPTATQKALETYPDCILICGGTTKKLPIKKLVEAINTHAKKVICLAGTGTMEIIQELDSDKLVGLYQNLPDAITAALATAKPRDTIVFSPGFTSFGMFKNEFDRGRRFNNLIEPYLYGQS